MTVGVQKLRGVPTHCFIAGTLVGAGGADVDTSVAKPTRLAESR